jgi:16S rRNA (cytidine1402-2'-O)-methyltransferase
MRVSLILAATPLGNPGDASARLIAALTTADVIAAEDSRRFHRLAADLGITFTARIISFFEGNEDARTKEVLEFLKNGATVVVVSDAGMPTISDPGFKLMRDAIAADINVSVLPGPSAVTMAIALAGLPTDRFTFDGFAPRSSGARQKFYESLRFEERTIVLFEAPHRLSESLADAVAAIGGDRLGAICREMTKRYEETIRGTLSQLQDWATSNEVLGEITLVIAGAPIGDASVTSGDMASRVREFEGAGMDRKEAITTVAREFKIPKKLVYAAVIEANKMSQ